MPLNPRKDAFPPCHLWWGLGDWFDMVLCRLAPPDVAACRLVSRAWRAQVSAVLCHLGPALPPGSSEEELAAAVAAAFPRLRALSLRLATDGGCSGYGGGAGAAAISISSPPQHLPSLAAALGLYSAQLALRMLRLEAPATRRPAVLLCPAATRSLACLSFLESLSLTGLVVCLDGAGLDKLSRLSTLELSNCTLRGCVEDEEGSRDGNGNFPSAGDETSAAREGRGCLVQLLLPLAGALRRLALRGGVEAEGGCRGGALAGVGAFHQLEALELDGDYYLPPAVWREVVALPRLRELSFRRGAQTWGRNEFEDLALTDRSLAQLALHAPQLRNLALGGHTLIGDEGVGHIARMVQLTELDFRKRSMVLHPGGSFGGGSGGVTDLGLQQLSRLTSLKSLTLGGLPLVEGGCGAVARLTALSKLQLLGCEALRDQGVHRLSTLWQLRELALVECPKVSDIGISSLLKHISRLVSLDLSGCDRNLSDAGLASIAQTIGLQRLLLNYCHQLTEGGLVLQLPRLRSLTHLGLRDCCQLGNRTCSLLAASCPLLESLDLEHCRAVGDEGLLALAGLRRLMHVKVHKTCATEAALQALAMRKQGRRLRIDSSKPRWWMGREA